MSESGYNVPQKGVGHWIANAVSRALLTGLFAIAVPASALAQVCTDLDPTPIPMSATGLGDGPLTTIQGVDGTRTVRADISALAGTGTAARLRREFSPGVLRIEFAAGQTPADTANYDISFAQATGVRLVSGPTFGSVNSNMDRSWDAYTFEALGASPGFSWTVAGSNATTTNIVNAGTSIFVEGIGTEFNFAEFDIRANGTLTGVRVTYTSPIGAPAFNSAQFEFEVNACQSDLGDAPSVFGAPEHAALVGFTLGSSIDVETSPQSNATATGDDSDGNDDEDGVTFPALTENVSATINVAVNQPSSGDGFLNAWIDWNGNNSFESTEQIATNLQFTGGSSGTIPVTVTPPSGSVTTGAVARFRWSDTAGLTAAAAALAGEVEDYLVPIQAAAPALQLTKSVVSVTDTNANTLTDAGDVINYGFRVENVGNVALTNVTVADALLAGANGTLSGGSIGSLAPGAVDTATFTGTYTIQQSDVVAGGVENTATVTGSSPGNTNDVTDVSDTGSGSESTNDPDLGEPGDPSGSIGDDDADPTNDPTVTMIAPAVIQAVDDALSGVEGLTGATTASVLENDTLNGAILNPADISLTGTGTASDGTTPLGLDVTPAQGGITLNADGTVTVAPQTTAGTYVYSYEICEALNPTNCSVAQATLSISTTSLIAEIEEDLIDILEEDRATTIELQSRQARDFASGALNRLRERTGRECEAAVNGRLQDWPILFDVDKAIIKPESAPILDEIRDVLGTCEGSRFEIAGHTDSDASDEYNLALSQRRVDAVLRALTARDLDTDGYEARGYGERRPIASNATAQGKARNRRVEFILIEEQDDRISCEDSSVLDRRFNLTADGTQLATDGSFFSESYDCTRAVWQTFEGALSYLETDSGISQTLLNLTYRRERFTSNDSVRGYFVGLYGSTNDISSRADGEIDGFGINAGIFGANRLNNGLFFDYYLGAAAGRHDFDLDFDRNLGTIRATGDYTYVAGFVGVALSGELEYETYRVAPRVGLDYAYSPGTDADVVASLGTASESGSVELGSLTTTRIFTEVRIERGFVTWGSQLAFTPRIACYDSVGDFDNACSIGASLEYESAVDADGLQHSFRIEGERGDGFSVLSVAADVSKRLRVGRVSARSGITAEGALNFVGEYELLF